MSIVQFACAKFTREYNLLASKYSQGILFCACERKYSWNLIYSRVNLLLVLTRRKSILSFAHISIFKVLVMRTQTKFAHEYFFFLDYKLDAESGFRL